VNLLVKWNFDVIKMHGTTIKNKKKQLFPIIIATGAKDKGSSFLHSYVLKRIGTNGPSIFFIRRHPVYCRPSGMTLVSAYVNNSLYLENDYTFAVKETDANSVETKHSYNSFVRNFQKT
jgi:hypothetical protein